MDSYVSKQVWEKGHAKGAGKLSRKYYYFGDAILQRLLPRDPALSFIEIGCVPGRNMAYFWRTFGYQVSGVDYSDSIKETDYWLNEYGMQNFSLFHADFFTFEPEKKYDVVFSSGFVEHFEEYQKVFSRHCNLLNDNGWLIISMPNFRYGQKLIRLLLGNHVDIGRHNLSVMEPKLWKDLALQAGLEVPFCDYALTFELWLPVEYDEKWRRLVYRISLAIQTVLRLIHLDQIPNRWFSPYILLVAHKPSAQQKNIILKENGK